MSVKERAHRIIRQMRNPSAPQTFIVRFLNHQDKEHVWKALRVKGQVTYRNNKIRFHPDLSAEV